MTRKSAKPDRLWFYIVTVVVVLAVAAVPAARLYTSLDEWSDQPKARLEALKVILQLAAVGVVGGFVTWLLNERSKDQDRQFEARQKQADRLEALNVFRKDAVARLVTTTNRVRRAPIIIGVHRSKRAYGVQLRIILDARLALSLLRHDLDTAKPFEKGDEIRSAIFKMEDYLNGILSEWETSYRQLPESSADAWGAITSLEKLGDLRRGDGAPGFNREYLEGYREAVRLMRQEIFPPSLPAQESVHKPNVCGT
jgi:hypothetical protein